MWRCRERKKELKGTEESLNEQKQTVKIWLSNERDVLNTWDEVVSTALNDASIYTMFLYRLFIVFYIMCNF